MYFLDWNGEFQLLSIRVTAPRFAKLTDNTPCLDASRCGEDVCKLVVLQPYHQYYMLAPGN
jgi:hypothetical protein